MRSRQQLLFLVVGLCASLGAQASGPTASASFSIQDPVTHKRKPALEARLGQRICVEIEAELVPVGEHSMQLTVYDGLGNEIYRTTSRAIATGPSLGRSSCSNFDEDHDAPGTWWYVVELDGQPLMSTSIEVRPKPD